jgi:hypothetical protein
MCGSKDYSPAKLVSSPPGLSRAITFPSSLITNSNPIGSCARDLLGDKFATCSLLRTSFRGRPLLLVPLAFFRVSVAACAEGPGDGIGDA